MDLALTLSEEDVTFLDAYAAEHGLPSRAAAVRRAVDALRFEALSVAYAAAWDEWSASGEAVVWDRLA